jgi:hypothetical protein
MPNNNILAIAGGAVLFLIGLVLGLSAGGPDLREIEAAVGARLDAQQAAAEARLTAIEASVAKVSTDMTGGLDGLRGSVESGVSAIGDKIGGDLTGLGTSLTGAIETSRDASLAALESGLAGLRGQISEPAPAAGAPQAATAAPADPGTPAEGYTAGQTAVLSDGALRAFVSRVDDAAGAVRLRVNGADLTLVAGASETLTGPNGECRITLDAIDRGHAALSGACGDALGEPDGAAPGTMVDLAEGLRVFVSGVTDSGARIAVNGVQTKTIAVGEAIEVKVGDRSCSVSVETVDRGRVALGYVCG